MKERATFQWLNTVLNAMLVCVQTQETRRNQNFQTALQTPTTEKQRKSELHVPISHLEHRSNTKLLLFRLTSIWKASGDAGLSGSPRLKTVQLALQ